MSTPLSPQPLVSIMMPARNVARVVEQTLDSIVAQTYTNWELIFVDDGSTDDTLAVVQRYADRDPRIKLFPSNHGGRGQARNKCIELSTGEFVAVCDSDDISFPGRFQRQVEYLQTHPDIGVIGTFWIPFSSHVPNPNGPVRGFPTDPGAIARDFRRGKMRLHNATAMIRRELYARYGAYNTELRRAQDYEFFSRLSRQGVRYVTLPEPQLYYRQESGVPSRHYFIENGMFMAYADSILSGSRHPFVAFAASAKGRFWLFYYRLKYAYFFLKLSGQRLAGR